MTDENIGDSKLQVIVCNIHWDTQHQRHSSKNKERERPDQMALDIPDNVLSQASKKNNNFNDIIEQFVYNLLTRKFECEVSNCQIWLPPVDK